MDRRRLRQIIGTQALSEIAPLFDGWEETMIWSALGGCMGEVWCLENEPTPRVALVSISDFVFLAGDDALPDAKELVLAFLDKMGERNVIIAPQNDAWLQLLEELIGNSAKKYERYAIKKDPDAFDQKRLYQYANAIPTEFTLRPIDAELYPIVMATEWARDFCSSFSSCEDFIANGLGVVALREGEIVGGCSAYAYYPGGIEIEVDTRHDMRRRGIALACSAQLILNCLKRGLYPSWDAANRMSVALAEKLGYEEKGAYTVYEINP